MGLEGDVLFKLRDYIFKERRVTLSQVARFFKIDATALEPMLDIWVRKGVIVKEVQNTSCHGTCLECGQGALIYYHSLN